MSNSQSSLSCRSAGCAPTTGEQHWWNLSDVCSATSCASYFAIITSLCLSPSNRYAALPLYFDSICAFLFPHIVLECHRQYGAMVSIARLRVSFTKEYYSPSSAILHAISDFIRDIDFYTILCYNIYLCFSVLLHYRNKCSYVRTYGEKLKLRHVMTMMMSVNGTSGLCSSASWAAIMGS